MKTEMGPICPQCGAKLRVAEGKAGKQLRCHECWSVIELPSRRPGRSEQKLPPYRPMQQVIDRRPHGPKTKHSLTTARGVGAIVVTVALAALICGLLFKYGVGGSKQRLSAEPPAREPEGQPLTEETTVSPQRPVSPARDGPVLTGFLKGIEGEDLEGQERHVRRRRAPDEAVADAAAALHIPPAGPGAIERQELKGEPRKSREEVIHALANELGIETARIRAEEQQRFQQMVNMLAAYTYFDKFSAVMRNVDGVQVTRNIWDLPLRPRDSPTGFYPGNGRAATALNQLKKAALQVQSSERRVAQLDQQIRDLQARYQQERVALTNQIMREAARASRYGTGGRGFGGSGGGGGSSAGTGSSSRRRASPSRKGVAPQWGRQSHTRLKDLHRGYEARIAPLNREAAELQQKINDAYGQLRYWENMEGAFRRDEQYAVVKLEKERDARIEARVRELWKVPSLAFIYHYKSLEESIGKSKRVGEMLEKAGHPEKAEKTRKEAEELQEKLRQLVEEYFSGGKNANPRALPSEEKPAADVMKVVAPDSPLEAAAAP